VKKSRRYPAHVYLPPLLVAIVRPRAAQLDLPLSNYFSILLRNYLFGGVPSAISLPKDKPTAQVRERLPFSVKPAVWSDAEDAARRLGGSVSLLVEALATHDCASGRHEFTIWPASRR
jgi:hypothetical protein